MKIPVGAVPAVFARNHGEYLQEAAGISMTDPGEFVTFRSATSWSSAAAALSESGAIAVYFAVVGAGPTVEYEADLVRVVRDPNHGDEETDRLLQFVLPSTRSEGLWEPKVATLYAIKRCRQVAKAFPMTHLMKLSDDAAISPSFGYSHSMVYARCHEPGELECMLPGEVEHPEEFSEGATHRVFVTRYERSSAARKVCLDHYGYDCVVCGFNF
jgi:hypothetical protein